MGAKASQEGAPDGSANAGGYGGSGFGGASKEPMNKVQFAAVQLGGVPGAAAYHSSIIVNDMEFSFSDGGIQCADGLESHKQMSKQNEQKSGQPLPAPEVFDMGFSHYTGSMMKAALERHFQTGSYDFLRKNCNSFADCALFYLVQKRIDSKYRRLEQLGAKNPGIIASISGGQYTPNAKADGFDVDKLCQELDPAKKWDMPGQSLGGTNANSAEAMRAARLARLGGGGGGSSASPSAAAQSASGSAGGYPAVQSGSGATAASDGGAALGAAPCGEGL